MNATLHTCLLLGALVAGVRAQTTHLVGPGGLPQIRDALAVAAAGDIIEVQPGTYAQFKVNVGVTIRAITPGTVFVEHNAAFLPPGCATTPGCMETEAGTLIAPPPGQAVHCIGLYFKESGSWSVAVTSGTATFDRCTIRNYGSFWQVGVLHVSGARVHLQACTVQGLCCGSLAHALVAVGAVVTAVRCTFEGNQTAAHFSQSGSGVVLQSSHFQGSQLQLVGGYFPFGPVGVSALSLTASSSAWVSDSTITSTGALCSVNVSGGSTCLLARTSVTAACAGVGSGLIVGADSTTPLQNGAPFKVDWRTSPNQIVLVYASPGLGYLPLPGLTDQAVTIDLANAWLATVLVSNAAGLATTTWNMPAGLYLNTTIYVMAAGVTPTTFALSPPIGGVIR